MSIKWHHHKPLDRSILDDPTDSPVVPSEPKIDDEALTHLRSMGSEIIAIESRCNSLACLCEQDHEIRDMLSQIVDELSAMSKDFAAVIVELSGTCASAKVDTASH